MNKYISKIQITLIIYIIIYCKIIKYLILLNISLKIDVCRKKINILLTN